MSKNVQYNETQQSAAAAAAANSSLHGKSYLDEWEYYAFLMCLWSVHYYDKSPTVLFDRDQSSNFGVKQLITSSTSTSSTSASNGVSAAFVAGSSVQRASSSSTSTSSTSASNSASASAALISIVNGFSAHRELHEFAGARRLANDFVKQAFGLRMAVCKMCSER